MGKESYLRTDGERKAAEIWAERETIFPIEKKKHPWFFMLGIVLYFLTSVVLLLFFEVNSLGWLFVISSVVVLIILRESKYWQGFAVPLFWAGIIVMALLIGTATKEVSFEGAITSKLTLPRMQSELPWSSGMTTEEIAAYNLEQAQAEWSSRGYELSKIDLKDFSMDMIVPANDNGKVVLFLHGGHYLYGLTNDYRDAAVHFSKAAGNAKVLLPDYRCADRGQYPAALVDAMASYQWLLEQGYEGEKIILAGDGVGGGMAISMAMYLRDFALEMPKAIITWSALTDFKQKSHSVYDNLDRDPIMGPLMYSKEPSSHPYIVDASVNIEDVYLSPANGSFYGLPPMLMQVGSREVLLTDTESVAKRAVKMGASVQQTTYLAMFYGFQMAYDLPESEQAWLEIEEFITALDE